MDTINDNVKAHYTGDGGTNVAGRVRALLETMGPGRIPPERLAALDHFHVRGAEATAPSKAPRHRYIPCLGAKRPRPVSS